MVVTKDSFDPARAITDPGDGNVVGIWA